MYRRRWPRFLLLFIVFAPIAIFIFGSIVRLLWNGVLHPVLNVNEINFWQALGILVLSKILFTGFMGGGPRRYRRRMMRDWDKLTPEEKERFREEWRNRCGDWGTKPWSSGGEGTQTSTQI